MRSGKLWRCHHCFLEIMVRKRRFFMRIPNVTIKGCILRSECAVYGIWIQLTPFSNILKSWVHSLFSLCFTDGLDTKKWGSGNTYLIKARLGISLLQGFRLAAGRPREGNQQVARQDQPSQHFDVRLVTPLFNFRKAGSKGIAFWVSFWVSRLQPVGAQRQNMEHVACLRPSWKFTHGW